MIKRKYFKILLVLFNSNTYKVGMHYLIFRISYAIKIFDQTSFLILVIQVYYSLYLEALLSLNVHREIFYQKLTSNKNEVFSHFLIYIYIHLLFSHLHCISLKNMQASVFFKFQTLDAKLTPIALVMVSKCCHYLCYIMHK